LDDATAQDPLGDEAVEFRAGLQGEDGCGGQFVHG
jgi:hypothetical protein